MAPDGWKNTTIKDALEKVIDYRGKAPPKSNIGVRLITARNIRFGKLDLSHEEFIEADLYETWMNRGRPCGSDVLFTTEAPLGNACMFPSEGRYAVGQRAITLRPKEGILDSDYLLNYLLSPVGQNEIFKRSSGSTATGIKSKEFVKISLTLPPIEEQRSIGKILATWDRAIETTEKLIANSHAQKKALKQQLLTGKKRLPGFDGEWEDVCLADVVKIYDGTHQTPNYVDAGVPFYSVEHVTKNDFSQTKFVSEQVFIDECRRVKIEKGDILMTRIGDIGTAKLVDWDVRASFYVSLSLIKSNVNRVHSPFLAEVINSDRFQRELWKRTIHVAFPKKINLGEIGLCTLKIPSLEEQRQIADLLSSAQQKIIKYEDDLVRLREEKRALMQQLLTGKRRVKIAEAANA